MDKVVCFNPEFQVYEILPNISPSGNTSKGIVATEDQLFVMVSNYETLSVGDKFEPAQRHDQHIIGNFHFNLQGGSIIHKDRVYFTVHDSNSLYSISLRKNYPDFVTQDNIFNNLQ